MIVEWALYLGAYIIGSFSFALWISKFKGINLRQEGSGNLGATNVFRVMGWKWGLLIFFLDVSKGFFPTYWVMTLQPDAYFLHVSIGITVILGHTFSVFADFKGGKGVASALGMLIALNSTISGVVFILCFITIFLTKRVSPGSLLGCFLMPLGFYFYASNHVYTVVIVILSFLIIVRHKSNISRLIKREENPFL